MKQKKYAANNKFLLSPRSTAAALLIFSLAVFLIPIWTNTGVAYGGVIDKSDSFYVADTANVISADTENYIIEKNGELEALCGGQIVVATVDFLDSMDIEDYAYKLFDDWEIGDKDENNGILLLLTIGEENYWCMQGKGLESKLTSGDIDDILWDYLEEDFAAGDYDAGVRSVFDALYSRVSAIYGGAGSGSGTSGQPAVSGQQSASSSTGSNFFFLLGNCIIIFIVIMVLLFVVASLSKRRRRRYQTYDDMTPGVPRPRRRTVFIPVGRPRPPRPPRPPREPRPSGTDPFGGPSGPRPSSSRSTSRSSFGSSGAGRRTGSSRSSGGIGRGGGGRSRGGGAGRRH